MKLSISFFSVFLLLLSAYGQSPLIDSLRQALEKADHDTSRIVLMNRIAEEAEDTISLNFANQAMDLLLSLPPSFQHDNKKFYLYQKAEAYYWISSYYNRYTEEADSGIKYLQRTLQTALESNDPHHLGLVYNDFAVVYNYKGADTSLYWLQKSLPYTIASKDSAQLATAYSNFGHLYRIKGEYQRALDYLFLGMKLDEHFGNDADVAIELNNIGQIFFEMEFYREALDYGRKSLRMAKKIKDEHAIALRYNNLGGIYDEMKKYDSALAYYDSSLQIRTRIGTRSALAKSYLNIGLTWINLQDYDKAIAFYGLSIRYAKQTTDTATLLETYTSLAGAFLRKGIKTDSAEMLLKTAYKYYKVNGNARNMQSITRLLMDVYSNKKDFAKAYAFSLEYLAARDSVESKDARKDVLRKQFEFEYQNKAALAAAEQQKKDDAAEIRLSAQKKIRNLFIAGSIFLLIIIGLLFNRFWLKQKAAKELEEKNKVIEQEKLRAEESEQFKSRFLANMSHEIRTPMNAVIGLTNLLLDTPVTEQQRFYLEAIRKSSENLMVILNDVLDLSKLEAGKMQLEKSPFSIREVTENVMNTLRHKAEETGLGIEMNISKAVPDYVLGDSTRLFQVLINLIGNAIKFTEKGKVTVEVTGELTESIALSPLSSFANVTFQIKDTGIGISKEKLNTIFESFRQAAADTSRKYGGTGLGLSIAQQIVQLHGSEIKVASEENKGSVFSFTIPYESSTAEAYRKIHRPVAEIDYSRFASLKLLLAEDNEYNQLVTVESLKRLVPTMRIDVTENGKEALEALSEESYDVILMDVQMPELNGYEATKKIRQEFTGEKKAIPIIALTASATREEIENGFNAGISAHLAKPFVATELLMLIAGVLGWNAAGTQQQALLAGSINTDSGKIDLSALRKYCDGDTALMKLYIEKFIQSAPLALTEIKSAMENQEAGKFNRKIHSIKPQLLMFGLVHLHHLATEMESNAASGLTAEKVQHLIIPFEAALQMTLVQLSGILNDGQLPVS